MHGARGLFFFKDQPPFSAVQRRFDFLFSEEYCFVSMALGSTQPLTEMSTRNVSWGVKVAGA